LNFTGSGFSASLAVSLFWLTALAATGVPTVKKFTGRKVAVARIWNAVQRLADDVAPQSTQDAPQKARSKKGAAKGKRRDTAQRGAARNSRARAASNPPSWI
jgi:hypothetical protein